MESVSKSKALSEFGNARRFISSHGRYVRYCEAWKKFLTWDGKRWELDCTRKAHKRARDTVLAMFAEATELLAHGESARDLIDFAQRSATARGIRDMLEVVKTYQNIAVRPLDLDQHPWLLNVANGTLDLRTGHLGSHRRGDRLTALLNVPYCPSEQCPRWEQFVSEIFAGDAELERYFQQAIGYSLTGSVREQLLFICHGAGANGKSVALGTIQELLGPDYAMKSAPDLLMARTNDPHPTERADLYGKRFVAAIETEDGRRLSESLVKELTGGDRIRARRMREDFWEFDPTHKFFLSTNHRPAVRGTDHGIWRRLRLIPFNVTFPPEQQDKNLPENLRHEFPGILRWAVQGCLDWYTNGFCEPEAVKLATSEYRSDQDTIGRFIGECCLTGNPSYRVKASDLFSQYKRWSEENGEQPSTQKRFGDYLSQNGYTREKSSCTWYRGLALGGSG